MNDSACVQELIMIQRQSFEIAFWHDDSRDFHSSFKLFELLHRRLFQITCRAEWTYAIISSLMKNLTEKNQVNYFDLGCDETQNNFDLWNMITSDVKFDPRV